MNWKEENRSGKREKTDGKFIVRVDRLKAGMLLAEDLKALNGRLIMAKGTCLTLKLLRIIRMWGVTEASIQERGIVKEEPAYLKGETVPVDAESEAMAAEFFRFTDRDNEVNRLLMGLLLEHNPGLVNVPREHAGYYASVADDIDLMGEPGEETGTGEEDIRWKLEEEIKLPSLPDIVVRINEAINNPTCTATHIADIIMKDSSLTARLLRLVNSGFYSFPSPIESISRAVTIIGSKQLSELALGTAVISTFERIPAGLVDMKSFWKHSVACGIICRLIAGYRKNTNTESYFLAGLLHDIGRLLYYIYFPRQAKQIFQRAYSGRNPLLMHTVEEEMTGIDHAELGSLLIRKWHLPPILEYACRYHHTPMESPDPAVSAIVHTGDIIANAMRFGSSGEYYVPDLAPGAWQEVGLTPGVLAPIVRLTAQILDETVQTYISPGP
ncbi:MAG: HDOD domain-containing protein [bacterium]|nr:HDOD domain-containing protein [bacterium]